MKLKENMRKFIVVLCISALFSLNSKAENANGEKGSLNKIVISDSISKNVSVADTITKIDSSRNLSVDSIIAPKKRNIWQAFIGYFGDANKEKKHKRFDINFIGGPHYSTDTQFGLGLVGAGLYRMDRNDTILPPSNVSLFGDISTVGFYLLGVSGTNIFPQDKYRLNYTLYFYSFPSYFWGIGYENGENNANKTTLKRFQAKIKGEFLFKVFDRFYAGPVLTWDYVNADPISNPELLQGMPLCTRNYGFGATVTYDTRDYLTSASKGVYVYLNQMFRPKFLWNEHAFSTTDFRFSAYKKAWKGAVIAGDLRGTFNFGDPSWAMMANLGTSNTMRGYYEGRYRDKHLVQAQIELRQHVWRRNGIVVWVGTGAVFHDKESFGHFLPNYGIGYRWEFKKKMNVRLDLGFGKGNQMGFVFQINEAF